MGIFFFFKKRAHERRWGKVEGEGALNEFLRSAQRECLLGLAIKRSFMTQEREAPRLHLE